MSVEELLGRTLNDVEIKYAPESLYIQGPLEIPLPCPKVSVIGTRKPSPKGLSDAYSIAKKLSENHIIVVSGLADGIDTAAHKAAIDSGGRTIAVLGTPLNNVYPHKNSDLQQEIMENHLAISQFPVGYPITRKNFVIRNRTMALISDASIIVEAGDSSGSLHQGWETLRLGRPLFIWKTLLNDSKLDWPKTMIEYGATELDDPMDVLGVIPSHLKMIDLFQ
ncbi:MAG: DNA-processing protein DprA [Candidatus Nitrosotenuis sp.]